MVNVDPLEARKLAQAIRNRASPQQAADALAIRDKWFLEAELGLLVMTHEARTVLEEASAQPGRGLILGATNFEHDPNARKVIADVIRPSPRNLV